MAFSALATLQLLTCVTAQFVASDMCQQRVPNLVNYKDCGIMQEHICCTLTLDVAYPKRCLIAAWSSLQQHVIDEAINRWRGLLYTCDS